MAKLVRKSLYLTPEHNRKLKRVAARLGCAEAEVLRAAIDHLPDPGEDPLAALEAAGLLASESPLPPSLRGVSREALEGAVRPALADTRTRPLGLGEAVLAERAARPAPR